MKISRIQGGSNDNIDTHKSKYYRGAFLEIYREIKENVGIIIDPFARNCQWGDLTNDINPETSAMNNLDALEFLETIPTNSGKLILFDPPFSDRQSNEKYGTSNLYSSDSNKISRIQNEFARILRAGGYVIKLGYNSTRIKGLKLIEIRIVNFGGSRNDVILSIHKKLNHNLEDFE